MAKGKIGVSVLKEKPTVSKDKIKRWKPVSKSINLNDLKLSKDLVVTNKYNGEYTVFCYVKDVGLYGINRYDRKRGVEFPHVKELKKQLDKVPGLNQAILLGETYAVDDKNRMTDLPTFIRSIKGKEPKLKNIRVALFDLISVNGRNVRESYYWKLEELNDWLKKSKIVHPVLYIKPDSIDEIKKFWQDNIRGKGYEGIVARSEGNIYKIKPKDTIDCVVVGVNKKKLFKDKLVSSVKVALMTKEGKYLVITDVTITDSKMRQALYGFAQKYKIREDSKTVWVDPALIIEIEHTGKPVKSKRPLFNEELRQVGEMDFVSVLSPKFVSVRTDKDVNPEDLRLEQVPI